MKAAQLVRKQVSVVSLKTGRLIDGPISIPEAQVSEWIRVAKSSNCYGNPGGPFTESQCRDLGFDPRQALSTYTGDDGKPLFDFAPEFSIEVEDGIYPSKFSKLRVSEKRLSAEILESLNQMMARFSDQELDSFFTSSQTNSILIGLMMGNLNFVSRRLRLVGSLLFPAAGIDEILQKIDQHLEANGLKPRL